MAVVEYPAKSKKIWPLNASTPSQASSVAKGPLLQPKMVSAVGASMTSARTIFWNMPSVIRNRPQESISRVARRGVRH